MNTAKKIYESDDAGVVHVDVPVGGPGRRVEVVVVWEDVADAPGAIDSSEDWSDLFGILKDVPLERPPLCRGPQHERSRRPAGGRRSPARPAREYEKRDPVG